MRPYQKRKLVIDPFELQIKTTIQEVSYVICKSTLTTTRHRSTRFFASSLLTFLDLKNGIISGRRRNNYLIGDLHHIAVYSHFVFNALWVIQHVPKIDAGASERPYERNISIFFNPQTVKSTPDCYGSKKIFSE